MNFTDLFGRPSPEISQPQTPAEKKRKKAKTTQAHEDLLAIREDLSSAFDKAKAFLQESVTPKCSEKSIMEVRATLFALVHILESEMKTAKNSIKDLLLPMMEEKCKTRLPVDALGKVVEYQVFNDRKTPSKQDLTKAFGAKGVTFWNNLPVRPHTRLGLKNLDKVST